MSPARVLHWRVITIYPNQIPQQQPTAPSSSVTSFVFLAAPCPTPMPVLGRIETGVVQMDLLMVGGGVGTGGIIIAMQGGDEADPDQQNATLIDEFIEAVKQEQLHPDLLPHQQRHVSTLSALLKQQRARLREFLDHDNEDVNKADKNFRYVIYSSEVEKLQYLLKLYSRIRLKKIQVYCFHLTKLAQQHAHLLSVPQQNFLRKYSELRYQHYHQTVFRLFMKNYRDFKGIEVLLAKKDEPGRERRLLVDTKQSQIELRGPDLTQFVFARILHNPQQVRFGINIKVSNMQEGHAVIPANAVVFVQYRVLTEAFPQSKHYRLL